MMNEVFLLRGPSARRPDPVHPGPALTHSYALMCRPAAYLVRGAMQPDLGPVMVCGPRLNPTLTPSRLLTRLDLDQFPWPRDGAETLVASPI